MTAKTLVENFETTLKFEPVKGCASGYVIRAKKSFRLINPKEKMSPADWDKFEKDIAEFKKTA